MSSRSFETPDAVMRQALALAARGVGSVEPNPPVGAVIVDDDLRVLGEGWHQKYGGPHAEVMALDQAGAAARGATLFVTLEPCCHFGKTPPCSRAVIAAGLRRVVAAMIDPAAQVNGGGIAELRAAGIDVSVGLCADEARALTAPFVQLVTQGRPWVHAKWAMTLDGKIAASTGHSQWISNPTSRMVAHQLRGRMDAVVVGIGTVLADDPLLTARPPGPRTATRIVLDPHARLPLSSQLVATTTVAPVIWVIADSVVGEQTQSFVSRGVELLPQPVDSQGRFDWRSLLRELGRRRMTHVLVEGGGRTLGSLFDAGLIDECHIFIAPKLVGGATAASPLMGTGLAAIPEAASLAMVETQTLSGDLYVHGRCSPPT